jgi:hypothetical protein
MSSVLWFVGAVTVCIGMLVVARRIEPHWVAKDGMRFLTTSELVDRYGKVVGRRREVRAELLADGDLMITHRSIVRSASSVCRIQAKSPNPPAGRQVYVLQAVPPAADGSMLALRLPETSPMVPVLDRLAPAGDQRSDT